MGSALHIPLPTGLKSGIYVTVKVTYKTTKDCTALQWLEKEYAHQIIITAWRNFHLIIFRQTQGKTFPYLFSQCQPIYARALAPLQGMPSLKFKQSVPSHFSPDTPSVKIVRVFVGLQEFDESQSAIEIQCYSYSCPSGPSIGHSSISPI
jgi:hypothetical protein